MPRRTTFWKCSSDIARGEFSVRCETSFANGSTRGDSTQEGQLLGRSIVRIAVSVFKKGLHRNY